MVIVDVVIKNGYQGINVVGKITDSQYCPRVSVGGIYLGMGASADSEKYVSSSIRPDGDITVLVKNAFSAISEPLTFVYPARTS